MPDSLALMIIYTGVMLSLIGLFIFGRMKVFQGTPVERALMVLLGLPNLLGTCCFTIIFSCGNKKVGNERWGKFSSYFTEKKNPILQFFYLLLVLPAMYGFCTRVVPFLPTFLEQVVGTAYCLAGLGSFMVACYAPNGVVTEIPSSSPSPSSSGGKGKKGMKKNRGADATAGTPPPPSALPSKKDAQNTRFEYDGLLYNKQDCRTCKTVRPARSKHCRICGHCVRRFDHHCAWLNCDVGEENLRWFHLFLIVHFTLCAYASFVCLNFMKNEALRLRLWKAHFISESGERFAATTSTVIMYLLRSNPIIFAITAFCAAVSVMLLVFWLMHLRLVLNNTTTNETNKISDVLDYLDNRADFKQHWNREVNKAKTRNAARGTEEEKEQVNEYSSLTDANIQDYVELVPSSEPKKLLALWVEYEALVISHLPEDFKKKVAVTGEEINVAGKDSVTRKAARKARSTLEARLKGTYSRGWVNNIIEVVFPHSKAS